MMHGQVSVVFMPKTDINSYNESYICSTMASVNKQARHYNITPILNFDQPC